MDAAVAAAAAVRRLEDKDVRAIFESLHEGKPPPPNLQFKIVPVGPNGLKLSPPSHEFPDGLYVLLRPKSKSKNNNQNDLPKVPHHLQNLVMGDIPPETCPWSLSGPQFPQPTAIQQRYCYPKGRPEYSSHKGGALWTMYRKDGKEDLEFRLLHVYFSAKRAVNKGAVVGSGGNDTAISTTVAATCSFSSSSLSSPAKRTKKAMTGGSCPSTTTTSLLSVLSPIGGVRKHSLTTSRLSTPGCTKYLLPLSPHASHHLKSPAITASTAANSPSTTYTNHSSGSRCFDSPMSLATVFAPFSPDTRSLMVAPAVPPPHPPPPPPPPHQLLLPPLPSLTSASRETGASTASNFVSPAQRQHNVRPHRGMFLNGTHPSPLHNMNRDSFGGSVDTNNHDIRGCCSEAIEGGFMSPPPSPSPSPSPLPPSDEQNFFGDDHHDEHDFDSKAEAGDNDAVDDDDDEEDGNNVSFRYMEPFSYDTDPSDIMTNLDMIWNDPFLNGTHMLDCGDAPPAAATTTRSHRHHHFCHYPSSDSMFLHNLSSKLDMVHESIQDAILASPTATEQSAMLNLLVDWARHVAADPLAYSSYCTSNNNNNNNSHENNENQSNTTSVMMEGSRPSRPFVSYESGGDGAHLTEERSGNEDQHHDGFIANNEKTLRL